jgi:hypothetical protein
MGEVEARTSYYKKDKKKIVIVFQDEDEFEKIDGKQYVVDGQKYTVSKARSH